MKMRNRFGVDSVVSISACMEAIVISPRKTNLLLRVLTLRQTYASLNVPSSLQDYRLRSFLASTSSNLFCPTKLSPVESVFLSTEGSCLQPQIPPWYNACTNQPNNGNSTLFTEIPPTN